MRRKTAESGTNLTRNSIFLGGEYEEEDDGEFPSPPPPEHLAKLSMEAQFKVS
jgi:hypothetical protein